MNNLMMWRKPKNPFDDVLSTMNQLHTFADRIWEPLDLVYGVRPVTDEKFPGTNEYVIPGIDSEHVDIHVDNNVLMIHAEQDGRKYSFSQTLSHKCDCDNIEAVVKNGILKVTINAKVDDDKHKKKVVVKNE